jgi:hypothetical protein
LCVTIIKVKGVESPASLKIHNYAGGSLERVGFPQSVVGSGIESSRLAILEGKSTKKAAFGSSVASLAHQYLPKPNVKMKLTLQSAAPLGKEKFCFFPWSYRIQIESVNGIWSSIIYGSRSQ